MKLPATMSILAAIALLGATAPASAVELTDADVENLVRRSYQYVAMYNVNNLSLIHISEPTRRACRSRMPSSA